MQATWFSTQPTQNASEYMGAGALARAGMANAQDAEYAIDQKRKLQQVFSKYLDKVGNLDEGSFYKAVSSEGLDPQHAAIAMEWRKQQIPAAEAEARHKIFSQRIGADTQAEGRNNATFGAPKPSVIPGTAQQPPQQDQDIFGGPAPKEPPVSTTKTEPTNNIPKTEQSSKNPIVAAAPPPPAPETQQAKDLGASTPVAGVTSSDTIHGWFNTARAKAIADNQAQESMKQNLAQFLGMQPKQEEQPAPVIPTDTQVAPANTVRITADNAAPSKAGEGKLPMPEIPTTEYTQPQEDNRSFTQRYADSITDPAAAMSRMQNQGTGREVTEEDFKWAPKDDGTDKFRQYKATLDTKLKSAGFVDDKGNPDASKFLRTIYENELASNMPAPVDPSAFDPSMEGQQKYLAAVQENNSKVMQAKGKAATALATARLALSKEATERGSQYFTEDTNKMAHITQNLGLEQVTAPGISGHLPNPAIRAAAADASAAAKSTKELVAKLPDAGSATWLPAKMLIAKNVIKLYNLPVGEGLLNEVSGMVQNGASTAEVQQKLSKDGVEGAIATAAAQVLGQFAGLNDPAGVRYLAKHAVDFARETYGNYGKGATFDTEYPSIGSPESKPGGAKPAAGTDQKPTKAQPKPAKVQPKAVKDIKKRSF